MAETTTNMPSDTAPNPKRDASLGELVSELSQEAMTLARKEIELAKVEMTEKINKVVKDLVFLAAGGAIAYLGLFFILFGVAEILAEAMDEDLRWLAFGIVGLVVAGIGYFLVNKGMNEMKEIDPVPQQTVETLKEDKEWAQRQL